MVPCLGHKKSKLGCQDCRRRKVKCDEIHPTCGHCARHGVICEYDRDHNPSTTRPVPQPSGPPISSSNEVVNVESQRRALMDVSLIQVFCTNVCPELPSTIPDDVRKIWAEDVLGLAIGYPPLFKMIAVLALRFVELSSAEFRYLALTDDADTVRARYLEAALREHSRSTSEDDTSPSVAEAKCFTSVMLCYEAFCCLRGRSFTPYHPPMEWLDGCKDMMAIISENLDIVANNSSASIRKAIKDCCPTTKSVFVYGRENRDRFPYLLERSQANPENAVDQQAYVKTAYFIGALVAELENYQPMLRIASKVLMLPGLMPLRFLEMVRERRPRALVMLAHYFGVACRCRCVWLVGGIPAMEIRAIMIYLGAQWTESMAWPMRSLLG
ncbi:hypothetical protein ACHAQJ_003380 [Trichoderma viride]